MSYRNHKDRTLKKDEWIAGPVMNADELRIGCCRLLMDLGYAPLTEFTLKNQRRADIAGMNQKGGFVIIEIKSSRTDFRADQQWNEYLDFADEFYFAVAESFPSEILPSQEGLIIADAFGAEIVRKAKHRPMAASRRRSLAMRFGYTAALRLHQTASIQA